MPVAVLKTGRRTEVLVGEIRRRIEFEAVVVGVLGIGRGTEFNWEDILDGRLKQRIGGMGNLMFEMQMRRRESEVVTRIRG